MAHVVLPSSSSALRTKCERTKVAEYDVAGHLQSGGVLSCTFRLLALCVWLSSVYFLADRKVVVINLEDSIAVTQNYVSRKELASVLYFMKHRQSTHHP